MNDFPFGFVPILALVAALAQLAWYVAVILFLYRIWKKVKHLPG
jgi:hypothetical protein